MSYIRHSCNPEGIYIWDDGENTNITCNKFKDEIKTIPSKTFSALIRKYKRKNDCEYNNAEIKEVFIESHKKQTAIEKELEFKDGRFQMRLSYKDWYIDMWLVTWEYIVNQH